ncbi:cytochrome P450 [Lentinula lateritia]|uniref:Cytochrome P450 n=1 Tax=Lentinula lateritia TaxID=40482 RepID=A0ABQ8VBH5_9AGAR|nr:cytochrome P450 [Lentinula lateritia]
MSEFLSHLQTHRNILVIDYSSLLQSVVVAVLSASLWRLLFHRRKLQGVTHLGQLRGPRSQSWLKGNYSQLFNLKRGWEFHRFLADEYGPTVQLKGFLGRKQLYTFDTKAMHYILVKERCFVPTSSYRNLRSGALLLGKGLLNTTGEHHRKQRKMLNPVFSIAHMRSMMPIFHNVVNQLRDALLHRVQNGPQEIDLLGWMARAALELIGQSGFGYSFDNMMDDVPKHKYSTVIKDLVLPTNVRTFLMNITPWKTLHDVRDMVNYMHELSVEIYEEKKRAFEEGDEAVVRQIGKGKDLLSIMMKENMKAHDEDKLEEAEIIAQMSTFIFAAMDTTSSAMSRILHLLALHPEVQDKLRQEIIAAQKECQGGQLSYDELVGLPYLDAVCRETLRLYAPVSSMLRKSTEDAIIPLSRPMRGADGTEFTEIFLPKATTVVISILNANRNPELWGPDVLEWKPERWLSPLPESVVNSKMPGVYSHLMTFSGGSRSCIGFKFSQLEMKVVIAMLVENFKFSSSPTKNIFWQMTGITSPVVGGNSRHPHLPLMVELNKWNINSCYILGYANLEHRTDDFES